MYSLKQHSLQLIILRGKKEHKKKTGFVITVYAVIRGEEILRTNNVITNDTINNVQKYSSPKECAAEVLHQSDL